MLSRRLALHNPNCRGLCASGDCVQDLEAFAGSIRVAHFGAGVKRSNGSIDGQLTLSSADADDVLAYLLSRAWELAQRFNPVDDGRGTTRLAGFLAQRLHFAWTDWTRKRFGATRYGPVAVFTPTADPELHVTDVWLDAEYEGGYEDALDLDAATREALELIRPLIDDETVTIAQAAERAHVKPYHVTRALTQVRAATRRQGLIPPDEERHTLADQAAELRKQRMTYQQIADALNVGSGHAARALLVDYHPELVKVRANRPRKAIRSRVSAQRASGVSAPSHLRNRGELVARSRTH
jgi:DNA-directed RNA polymerase specialized sigma24 family protein